MAHWLGPRKLVRVSRVLGINVESAEATHGGWAIAHEGGRRWNVHVASGRVELLDTAEERAEWDARRGTMCPLLALYEPKPPPPPGCRYCLKQPRTCPARLAEGGGVNSQEQHGSDQH